MLAIGIEHRQKMDDKEKLELDSCESPTEWVRAYLRLRGGPVAIAEIYAAARPFGWTGHEIRDGINAVKPECQWYLALYNKGDKVWGE